MWWILDMRQILDSLDYFTRISLSCHVIQKDLISSQETTSTKDAVTFVTPFCFIEALQQQRINIW